MNIQIGWSDHTVSPGVIYRAVHKFRANIIEFHLDLDGQGEEYTSGHCWLPEDIKIVINSFGNRNGIILCKEKGLSISHLLLAIVQIGNIYL